MKYNNLKELPVRLGCDPELFLRRGDDIVGSEVVIGKRPLLTRIGLDKVIVDGVQAELNPEESTCRTLLNSHIASCIHALHSRALGMGYTLDFSQGVWLNDEQLAIMPESCKTFGCKPSFNTNGGGGIPNIDAREYLFRGAGGHIHLGASESKGIKMLQDVNRTVRALDIMLGNTFVLLDRAAENIERRKNYGRAGEYRLPEYGLEYRTLSNFWLTHPMLSSLAFGLARHAIDIVFSGLDKELFKLVDYQKVVYAINNNDFGTAMDNFNDIKVAVFGSIPFPENRLTDKRYPVDDLTLPILEKMIEVGVTNFLETDNDSIVSNWGENYYVGFHDYANITFAKEFMG